MERMYHTGDHVRMIGDFVDLMEDPRSTVGGANKELKAGMTGTVLYVGPGTHLYVEWDLAVPSDWFHNCQGRCQRGYGYIVNKFMVEPFQTMPPVEAESLMASLDYLL